MLLTDGAKYLADQAGVIGGSAYWLIDIIASHGGRSIEDAGSWLGELLQQGRYARDIY